MVAGSKRTGKGSVNEETKREGHGMHWGRGGLRIDTWGDAPARLYTIIHVKLNSSLITCRFSVSFTSSVFGACLLA